MPSGKIPRELTNRRIFSLLIETSRLPGGFLIALRQISSPMTESSFMVIVLSSISYPYSKLDTEQDAMSKPLVYVINEENE